MSRGAVQPRPAAATGLPWVLACLGTGMLAALLPVLPSTGARGGFEAGPPGPGRGPRALVWAADRDGGMVLRLDDELLILDARRLPRPSRLLPTLDGGAWVACAREGRPLGAHRLVRLDGALEPVAAHELGAVLDLAVGSGDEALVLEARQEGPERVLRCEIGGAPVTLLELPGARALAADQGWWAAGDGRGRLAIRGPGGEAVTVSLPGALGPLAPAPGGWWVLAREGTLLLRLTRAGSPLAVASCGLAAPRLAPDAEGGLWVCDAEGVRVERRDGAGRLRWARDLPQALALGPAVATADGGLVLAAPGALLALDGGGALRRGQGGFERLADLARAHLDGRGPPTWE